MTARSRKAPAPLEPDRVYHGDARDLLPRVAPDSVALACWSPPYFVGKSYEAGVTLDQWQDLLAAVVGLHTRLLKPGGFLAVNIADILCFPDPAIPRVQAETAAGTRLGVTRDDVLAVMARRPKATRYEIAKLLGVSEQTVDRRLNGNNIRGGKYAPQTRVKLAGGFLEEAAYAAGLYLYDRRVWVKDPAWANGRWHANSYRAVDEFEHVYVFWKPGVTRVDRGRLGKKEWAEWGSRGVWHIRSVRANDDHEAKFPAELPRRLVRLLTDPGEVVLDCFLGSGTTAVVAAGEGRRFLGIEKDAGYVELARRACEAALGRASGVTPAAGSRKRKKSK